MTVELRIRVASRTHVGLVRKRNEDSYYQGEWLYAVADGLGGHVAGDEASAAAIEAIKPYDKLVEPAELADSLGVAIRDADSAIRQKVREQPRLAGMGTTVVAILRSGTRAVLANIGDSRAYIMRQGSHRLIQISEDHLYKHLVANSDDVPDLGEKLARFLDGRKDGRSPDLTDLALSAGDRILLCSDGLSSYVPHTLIEQIISEREQVDQAAEALVEAALSRGGLDNVTVIVMIVTPS